MLTVTASAGVDSSTVRTSLRRRNEPREADPRRRRDGYGACCNESDGPRLTALPHGTKSERDHADTHALEATAPLCDCDPRHHGSTVSAASLAGAAWPSAFRGNQPQRESQSVDLGIASPNDREFWLLPVCAKFNNQA